MNTYVRGWRVTWASALTVALVAGCAAPPQEQGAPQAPRCGALADAISRSRGTLDALLEHAVAASRGDRGMTRVRDTFATLQARMPLEGTLCDDFAEERIDRDAYHAGALCLGERLEALEAMRRDFADAARQPMDVRQLTWRLDAKIDWVRQTMACEVGAYAGTPRGGELTQRDAIQLGAALQVSTALLCERRSEVAAEVVERCNGATLHDGDRFKVMVHTSAPAHLYFYLFNGSGQFQMFFPDLGVPNRTEAGGRYALPDASWMRLDDVSDVFERIVVVASRRPIEELEELRGVNLPPTPSGDFALQARDVRGIIEPLITRGAGIEQTAPIEIDGSRRPVFPVVVEDEHTVAIEYVIYHAQQP